LLLDPVFAHYIDPSDRSFLPVSASRISNMPGSQQEARSRGSLDSPPAGAHERPETMTGTRA
jgi:hypothetical protein